jgi:hypothetical protein
MQLACYPVIVLPLHTLPSTPVTADPLTSVAQSPPSSWRTFLLRLEEVPCSDLVAQTGHP